MDNHTPEQRHKNMQAVKNKNTKIEVLLRKELWSRGLRYQKNSKKVFGKPDIVFIVDILYNFVRIICIFAQKIYKTY